jgi:haloalkane dehalogenase
MKRHRFAHLYPFRSHFMEIGGLRYHYLDEGRGQPVFMLHGNPTWSFYYRRLVRALAPRHRVLAPDHIGCGLSEKPATDRYGYRLADRVRDFSHFVAALAPAGKIVLVGHDWGGMIAMAHAVAHPESIERIVLFNTAAFPVPAGKRLPLRLRAVRSTALPAALAVLGLNLFARSALWMASAHRLPPDVRAGLIAPYDRPRHRIATWKFVQDIPLRATDPSYGIVQRTGRLLRRLGRVPLLLCWGLRDFVFDIDYLNEWRRRFPHARVRAFPDAGHYVLEDVPHLIIPLVNDFLGEWRSDSELGPRAVAATRGTGSE